ncbi:hypothetical protein ACM66B_006998 [Microbotryomycetes sp. NB124-2]
MSAAVRSSARSTAGGPATQQPTSSSSPLLKTTVSLVALQLCSRLFSFALNQLLLRSTTAEALGVATIGFEVLRDTSLFLIREGLRGAIVRSRTTDVAHSGSAFTRTRYLPLMLSPAIFAFFGLYAKVATPTPKPASFNLTLALYAVSALLELWSEPFYLLALARWETMTSARVRVEGLAVGIKSVATLATIMRGGSRFALLSFGVGQVAYATTLLIGLWWATRASHEATSQQNDATEPKLDRELVKTGWALTKQSFVKQLLTEGDKIAVGRLSRLEDQGGYAVALNYGSLVARILFQPLEESSRLYFSRQLSSPSPDTLASSASLLQSFLLLYSHLGLILALLAPSFTTPLLFHLLGPRWVSSTSSAGPLLRTYCSTYLPLLAFNGFTEAFFQSSASPAWIRRGSLWMTFCSIAFIFAVGVSVKLQLAERGLIYANCFNMALRIAFSSTFIRAFFVDHGASEHVWANVAPRTWLPKVQTVFTFATACYVVRWSEQNADWMTKKGMAKHLGVGATCGLCCLGVTLWSERTALRRLAHLLRRRKSD